VLKVADTQPSSSQQMSDTLYLACRRRAQLSTSLKPDNIDCAVSGSLSVGEHDDKLTRIGHSFRVPVRLSVGRVDDKLKKRIGHSLSTFSSLSVNVVAQGDPTHSLG
jgi:hypothetical protein